MFIGNTFDGKDFHSARDLISAIEHAERVVGKD
jgi:hypothetical protein